mgnify:CR=1 FL=1
MPWMSLYASVITALFSHLFVLTIRQTSNHWSLPLPWKPSRWILVEKLWIRHSCPCEKKTFFPLHISSIISGCWIQLTLLSELIIFKYIVSVTFQLTCCFKTLINCCFHFRITKSKEIFVSKCRLYRVEMLMAYRRKYNASIGIKLPNGTFERPIGKDRLFWVRPGKGSPKKILQSKNAESKYNHTCAQQ